MTPRTDDSGWRCNECCNGDRCDDPTHHDRRNCQYCKGTGWAIWNLASKQTELQQCQQSLNGLIQINNENIDRIDNLQAENEKLKSSDTIRKPDGYAVVMDNGKGNFVGVWRTREVAENIHSKGRAENNEIIVPVYTLPLSEYEIYMHNEKLKEALSLALQYVPLHDDDKDTQDDIDKIYNLVNS